MTTSSNKSQTRKLMTGLGLCEQHSRSERVKQWLTWLKLNDRTQEFYKMTSYPRGFCVVINNFFANDRHKRRLGSTDDIKNLQTVWTNLGFEVMLVLDKNKHDLQLCLQKLSSDVKLKGHDCFVVILMSHGHNGEFVCNDGQTMQIYDILKCFNNKRCPVLRGKPKLFALQMCRGGKRDYGVSVDNLAADCSPKDGVSKSLNLPTFSDFFVSFASFEQQEALRSTENGSFYINSLCKTLKENGSELEMLDILKKVSENLFSSMGDIESGYRFQTPEFRCIGVCKKWKLNYICDAI